MKFKQLIVYGLAAVGVVAIGAGCLIWFVGSSVFDGVDSPVMQSSLDSPDGGHRAVRIINTGGGAAGWCHEYVVVQPTGSAIQVPKYSSAVSELVFDASCNTNFSLQWKSSSELLIRYEVSKPPELTSISSRALDGSHKVSVHVEPSI